MATSLLHCVGNADTQIADELCDLSQQLVCVPMLFYIIFCVILRTVGAAPNKRPICNRTQQADADAGKRHAVAVRGGRRSPFVFLAITN